MEESAMDSTGDEASDTDRAPDQLSQRSSSAVAGAGEEVQYAQNPLDDSQEAAEHNRQDLSDESPESQDDVEDETEQDDSDEGYERENRFEGPASTWRFYTESERALAASLDQERANNLSIHLYNAHALKARVRDPEASQVKHHHGKKHWIKANGDGTLPWHPDADWTVWPLKSGDVPRREEAFGVAVTSRDDEKGTYRKSESWKPSADLKEEIQAIMLREAKEKLRERENQRAVAKPSLPRTEAKESSPRKRKRSSSSTSSSLSSSDNEGESHSSHSDLHDSPAKGEDRRFEVLTDDEDAAEILQPSVHHIISKLDDILRGLHKSRRGHVKEPSSPRSRARYERRKSRDRRKSSASIDSEAAGEPADGTATNNGREDGRHLTSQATSDAASPASPIDAKSGLPTARPANRKPKRKPPLNPRDWSEVLGVATLVGWDPAIVQRATARCSALFGESMTFSELGKDSKREDKDRMESAQGFVVEGEDEGREEGYSCPVVSCPRHTEPRPLNKTWRWREHLKRSHKYSKVEIERTEAELKAKRDGKAVSGAPDAVEMEGSGIDGEAETEGQDATSG